MKNSYEAPSAEPSTGRPTRVRCLVVALAVLLAVVTYLDRACISVLKSDIAGDLGLTDKQMGWVVSAAMNTSGQIGSLISPVLVIYLVEWCGDWSVPLYLMGVLVLVGTVNWLFIDPRRPIFD